MASVDFQKNTFTGGAAMVRHMTRHDGQAVEYRNKFIDPERSGDNYIIGAGRFEDTSARGVMERLRERVRAVDEVQPPKRRVKDRVTVMTYTIAAPAGLSDAQERDFFRVAYEELARFSGGRENVSPGYVHRDEIHDYRDAATGERTTSRAHMHVAGIPYTAEKGVNGKAFETRARMRELNRTIDERCRRELGFKFLTGERGLTGRTVEELQAASETRTKRQERARLNAELADKRQEVRDLSGEVGDLERTRDAAREQAQAEQAKAEQARQDARQAEQARDKAAADAAKAQENAISLQTQAMSAEIELSDNQRKAAKLRESIDHAREQKLDALRERDAARGDRDVVKALSSLQKAVYSPFNTEVDILAARDAKTSLMGRETPATVTIRRDDFERLQEQAEVNARTRQAAQDITKAYRGMRTAAADVNQNRLDSFDRTRDAVTAQQAEEIDALRGDLSRTRQALQSEQERTRTLSGQVERLQEKADTLDRLAGAFPRTMERLQDIDTLERQFDRKGLSRGKLSEYAELCKAAGIPTREDIQQAIDRPARSHDWDLSL